MIVCMGTIRLDIRNRKITLLPRYFNFVTEKEESMQIIEQSATPPELTMIELKNVLTIVALLQAIL